MEKRIAPLISFEGIECSGKGTQIDLAAKWLTTKKIKCVREHEPGGTAYGEAIRVMLKNPELALPAIFEKVKDHSDYKEAIGKFKPFVKIDCSRNALFEIFLFMASRSLYANAIRTLLHEGITVLSDRLIDSTTAYQGGGWAHSDQKFLERINLLNRIAMSDIWPDLTIFLDIPIDTMYERMKLVHQEKNSFFEKKYDRNFYERVRRQYREIAKQEPDRFKVIDGTKPVGIVFAETQKHIQKLLEASKTASK